MMRVLEELSKLVIKKLNKKRKSWNWQYFNRYKRWFYRLITLYCMQNFYLTINTLVYIIYNIKAVCVAIVFVNLALEEI